MKYSDILGFFWKHIKPYKWYYLVMLLAPGNPTTVLVLGLVAGLCIEVAGIVLERGAGG